MLGLNIEISSLVVGIEHIDGDDTALHLLDDGQEEQREGCSHQLGAAAHLSEWRFAWFVQGAGREEEEEEKDGRGASFFF